MTQKDTQAAAPAASDPAKSAETNKTEKKWTMTKKLVVVLLIIGVAGGYMPFILAAFDKEPSTDMGIAWVTEVVAVVLGYLCKAYFETKQEAKQALDEYKAKKNAEYETGSSEIKGGGDGCG